MLNEFGKIVDRPQTDHDLILCIPVLLMYFINDEHSYSGRLLLLTLD